MHSCEETRLGVRGLVGYGTRLHPGEVEAGGWHVTAITAVVHQLMQASPHVTARPRVFALDGRGGTGKSTLAQRLASAVPASTVVHTDDVAWNQAYFDWGTLLAEGVLAPLHRGEAVCFTPPAWATNGREGAIAVPSGLDVVWVEGTGVIRRELAPWIDASLYVQGDLLIQQQRLFARDGDSQALRDHVAAWQVEELPRLLAERPWQQATVVLNGTSAIPHDLATEVVIAS